MRVFADMANKTIYGCYSNGVIIFEGGNFCTDCEHTGCFVASGEHAGQIQVTIVNELCNDTYYGCIDPITGNFQIEVPEVGCCQYEDGVCDAESANPVTIPFYIIVKFSGIKLCDGTPWEVLNDKCFCLWASSGNSCNNQYWGLYLSGYYSIAITNQPYPDGIRLNVYSVGDYVYFQDTVEIAWPFWEKLPIQAKNVVTCGPYHRPTEGGYALIMSGYGQSLFDVWEYNHKYIVGDAVYLNNDDYWSCILAHTSNFENAPPNETYWEIRSMDCG